MKFLFSYTLIGFQSAAILSQCGGCLPAAKTVDNSQFINSGVNIVPEAVQASMKAPPSSAPTDTDVPDVVDVIRESDQNHKVWLDLLRGSGLVPKLQKAGPYTVLAPTDEAFNKLPPGITDQLLQPAHHAELVNLVKYHLLDGRITFAQMIDTNGQLATMSDQKLIVKGTDNKVMINDANVIRSDASGSNGVVHWIDTVLDPSAQ